MCELFMLNYPWKLSLVAEVTEKSGFSMLQQTHNPLGTINNDTIHKILENSYSTAPTLFCHFGLYLTQKTPNMKS